MSDTNRLKILFIGNSITLHGPAPEIGWNGSWGMAASCEEHDYVRLVMDGVRRCAKEADFLRVNVADFERSYDQYDLQQLRQYREYEADIIIMRILENVDPSRFSDDSFGHAYAGLIRYLNPAGRARMLCVGSFWPCVRGDALVARTAAENGYDFLSLTVLHGDDRYKALGLFEHAGVAAHPSDCGMAAIAELILGRVTRWLCVRNP